MKRILVPLPLALLVATIISARVVAKGQADQPNRVVEPDTAEVFYKLEDSKLIPLERQTATIHGKASGFIVMNMKSVSEFPGGKSPVRFHSGEPLDFVVRSFAASSAVDPNSLYTLRRLDEKKKRRELVIMAGHFSPLGASTQTNLAQGVLPVEFSKYGNGSIKLRTAPLPPGEYAVSRIYGQTVFLLRRRLGVWA